MSMRILFCNILILTWLVPLAGQALKEAVSVHVGPELNLGRDIKIPEIFGHDESGYYAHTFDYRDGVEFFDRELNSVRKEYLDLVEGLRERTLLALFHFHDSLYMFTSEQRVKRMILYVETIDKETMLQNGDRRVVMNVPHLSGWFAEFGFKLSRQEQKLLVFSRTDVLSRRVQDLHFILFGKGLTPEWEADQRVNYPRRTPRESVVKVNEEGDVFIISLQDEQRLSSLWHITKNRYRMYAITDRGRVNKTYVLDFPNIYIRDVEIEPGEGHLVSLAGFYSPTYYRAMVDGVFYMELDNESGQFLNTRFHEFEPWFMEEAIPNNPRKPPDELFWYEIRHFIRRNNGDAILIAENEFDQTYDTYMNIIVMSFSPGGNLNWKRVIPKRQAIDPHQPLNYSSFQVHAPWYTDRVHLVFNDDNKNGVWPEGKKLKVFNPNDRANLKVVSVGPIGEISSSIIYRKSRRRMKTPVPLASYNLLNQEMIIPRIRYNRYEFMKIGFNE